MIQFETIDGDSVCVLPETIWMIVTPKKLALMSGGTKDNPEAISAIYFFHPNLTPMMVSKETALRLTRASEKSRRLPGDEWKRGQEEEDET